MCYYYNNNDHTADKHRVMALLPLVEGEVESIDDWYGLGTELKISHEFLANTKEAYPDNVSIAKSRMLTKWIYTDKAASISKIYEAIAAMTGNDLECYLKRLIVMVNVVG